jgi:hypothetical protein
MKAAQMAAIEHGTGDVYRVGCDIERELNAANDRIKRLEEAGDAIFLLAEKHAPEYWLYTQTAFNNWRKAKEDKL